MNEMSNISTLMTIIFGLMLTDLFASIHRLIRHRKKVRWHWLPLLVAWYVLATVLKNWWSIVFKAGGSVLGNGWIFFFYGHLLLLLYLVASSVLPDEIPTDGLNMYDFYFKNRRHFWGLLACLNLVLLLFALLRPIFSESSINWMVILSNFLMGAISLSLAWTRKYVYHAIVVSLFVILTVLEILMKF